MNKILGSNLLKLSVDSETQAYSATFPETQGAVGQASFVAMLFAAPWCGPSHAWGSLMRSFKYEVNQEYHGKARTNFFDLVVIPVLDDKTIQELVEASSNA